MLAALHLIICAGLGTIWGATSNQIEECHKVGGAYILIVYFQAIFRKNPTNQQSSKKHTSRV